MKKSNFDRLMQRYLAGDATDQEKIKIEAWLDVMKTKNTMDLELSKEDEEQLFKKITSPFNDIKEVISFQPEQEKKVNNTHWVIQVAAALLILTCVSYVVWNFVNKNEAQLLVTSQNGIEKIILNDGTIVWLRAGSKLTYFEKLKDGTRNTELQGEALFEVAKDASHPFIIKCGDVYVKVLGTSFSIKTRHDSLELLVLTGKVNLSSGTNTSGMDVEPNQKAIYNGNGQFEKISSEEKEVQAITSHTEYNMQFTDATMDDIFKKIEDKFDVKITLSNRQIGKCRITADFTDHSLENTLQMITEILDVNYNKKAGIITVSGNSCK
jgi:ferric-dicitrate binding protein FerR (iron transport regulator)